MYNFTEFKNALKKVEDWLAREFNSVRTGRATPMILDSVQVDSYGSKMAVNQLASVTTEDARSLRVVPWDLSQAKNIEKAIVVSNLGLSVSVDDKGLRVIFPELTSERREALLKLAKQKLEEARVSMRLERDQVWDEIQKKERAGAITEDDKFRFKAEMQKNVDEANKRLDEMLAKKEREITQ